MSAHFKTSYHPTIEIGDNARVLLYVCVCLCVCVCVCVVIKWENKCWECVCECVSKWWRESENKLCFVYTLLHDIWYNLDTRLWGRERARKREEGREWGRAQKFCWKKCWGNKVWQWDNFSLPLSFPLFSPSIFLYPIFIRKGCKQSVKYWNCQIKLGYQNLIEQTLSNWQSSFCRNVWIALNIFHFIWNTNNQSNGNMLQN